MSKPEEELTPTSGASKVDFNDVFSLRKPKDAKAGLSSGLKSLAKGVLGGAVGLIAAPVVGATQDGFVGFAKGLATGEHSKACRHCIRVLPECTRCVCKHQDTCFDGRCQTLTGQPCFTGCCQVCGTARPALSGCGNLSPCQGSCNFQVHPCSSGCDKSDCSSPRSVNFHDREVQKPQSKTWACFLRAWLTLPLSMCRSTVHHVANMWCVNDHAVCR